MSAIIQFLRKMKKKNLLEAAALDETKLARKLSALDQIGLGVGSPLGVGLCVLAGTVSRNRQGHPFYCPCSWLSLPRCLNVIQGLRKSGSSH